MAVSGNSRWCNEGRDQVTVDLNAIKDVLLRISQLVEALPVISKLDLNPIFGSGSSSGPGELRSCSIRTEHCSSSPANQKVHHRVTQSAVLT